MRRVCVRNPPESNVLVSAVFSLEICSATAAKQHTEDLNNEKKKKKPLKCYNPIARQTLTR